MTDQTDGYGNFKDWTGQTYSTSSGQPAGHGTPVNILDGSGISKPGIMQSGTAVPINQK